MSQVAPSTERPNPAVNRTRRKRGFDLASNRWRVSYLNTLGGAYYTSADPAFELRRGFQQVSMTRFL